MTWLAFCLRKIFFWKQSRGLVGSGEMGAGVMLGLGEGRGSGRGSLSTSGLQSTPETEPLGTYPCARCEPRM